MYNYEEILNKIKDLFFNIEEGDLLKIVELKKYLEELLEFYKKNLENLVSKELLEKWEKDLLQRIKNPEKVKEILPEIEEFAEKFKIYLENPKEKKKFLEEFLQKKLQTDIIQIESIENTYSKDYFQGIVKDINLLRKFYLEATEHLDSTQSLLIELEFDPTNSEILNTVFRDLHTIKGSSSFLGLKNFEDVSHTIEDLLAKARDKKIILNKDLIDIIFLGTKLIRTLLDILILEIDSKEFSFEKLTHNFKQINIFPYVSFMRDLIAKSEFKKIGEILQEEGKIKFAEIEKLLEKQTQTKEQLGTIAVKEGIIKEKDLESALQKQKEIKKRISESHYVKVAGIKLNTLVDLVGELVINQSILKQQLQEIKIKHKIDYSEKTIQQLDNITSMIKNIVLTLGMLPIRDIFNKLKIASRNIAKELNKVVVLETEGDETELDRSIIEILYEPLLHIVRNSIDHGIETPEEREAKQKPKVGKIFLKAENKGSEIWITIQDDGRGIQKEKILKKAIENHLIDKEKVDSLTEKQIYELIFLPGLSTKEEATHISGRGVGLDVVKKAMDSIHGKIEIESIEGQFTKFLLKLPLTLAIIDGFVVRVNSNKYVFPFNYIEEIFVFNHKEILNNQNKLYVNRREHLISIIFAHQILENKKDIPKKEIYQSVIVKYENQYLCIVVDEILGKQEIVIRNLGNIIKNKNFSGGTIFGDGNIGFVLDMEGFIKNI